MTLLTMAFIIIWVEATWVLCLQGNFESHRLLQSEINVNVVVVIRYGYQRELSKSMSKWLVSKIDKEKQCIHYVE